MWKSQSQRAWRQWRNFYQVQFVIGFCFAFEFPVESARKHTRRSQFAGGEHDVIEVESSVVNSAELMMRMIGLTEIFEWWLDPTEASEISVSHHVHAGSISVN